MFCPKCGTKNVDSVVRCGQCGFELKAEQGKAKFKGTMMMTGGAVPTTGASGMKSPLSPNLKGTMVGVAPPGEQEVAQAIAQKQAAAANKLKGTMVGVAPPNLDALKEQAARAGVRVAQAPAGEAGRNPADTPSPNSKLKGTMIGLAPPNMQAEIAAARAKMAEQKASAKAAEKPLQVQESLPSEASQSPSPPSKLKGTMIGVAPPNMQAEIQAAKDKFLAEKEGAAKLARGQVPEGDGPASAPVNPLGGTLMGTSPFTHSSTPPPDASSEVSGMANAAAETDYSDKTPAAGFDVQEAARISSLPEFGGSAEAKAFQTPSASTRPIGYDEEEPIASLPKKGSSAGPLMLLIVLLLAAVAAILALVLSGENAGEGETKPVTEPTNAEETPSK